MRVLCISLLLATLGLAACGGGSSTKPVKQPTVREQGPFGVGADRFWLYEPPSGPPRAMVIFLHGAGSLEPELYRPWLRHLAEEGDAVIFPVYEVDTGSPVALRDLINAVRAARLRLNSPFVPTVVIGYSRGGRLAVDYAALAPGVEQTPSAVLSVFPPLLLPAVEPAIDLGSIDPRTRIWILVGDRDQAVGREGARELLRRLDQANFPPSNVRAILVTSKGDFEASHGAPLRTSPAAKRAFWDRADRLIELVVDSS